MQLNILVYSGWKFSFKYSFFVGQRLQIESSLAFFHFLFWYYALWNIYNLYSSFPELTLKDHPLVVCFGLHLYHDYFVNGCWHSSPWVCWIVQYSCFRRIYCKFLAMNSIISTNHFQDYFEPKDQLLINCCCVRSVFAFKENLLAVLPSLLLSCPCFVWPTTQGNKIATNLMKWVTTIQI